MMETRSESPVAFEERMRAEAAAAGRTALEASLQRFTHEQRDAFWNAIGLYYSNRRHPGADEAAAQPAVTAA
ncbi:hypothetical protein ASF53_03080 [Methylobacterium sp. Leaf123]|uniref:hypothetical protein n=1 Tax=Methylobacterium sp. Leaf123 TaxID=1736264 RepID=UPI0006FEA053|nr:hypothetical protein [Methylobacterium sp. Leaf123]KQQ31688.1 hypothetical protein ASF53_03080 [Methylobacterium sp. Leaf123]